MRPIPSSAAAVHWCHCWRRGTLASAGLAKSLQTNTWVTCCACVAPFTTMFFKLQIANRHPRLRDAIFCGRKSARSLSFVSLLTAVTGVNPKFSFPFPAIFIIWRPCTWWHTEVSDPDLDSWNAQLIQQARENFSEAKLDVPDVRHVDDMGKVHHLKDLNWSKLTHRCQGMAQRTGQRFPRIRRTRFDVSSGLMCAISEHGRLRMPSRQKEPGLAKAGFNSTNQGTIRSSIITSVMALRIP